MVCFFFFFFKQKTAYEMRISDWSSDVCSSDLREGSGLGQAPDQHEEDKQQEDDVDEGQDAPFPVELARAAPELHGWRPTACRIGRKGDVAQIGRASCRERVRQYV